jgi:hypothetical protein
MSVDRIDRRAESLELGGQRLDCHDRVHRAIALGSIYVHNHPHRIEFVVREGLHRFPGLPLLEFSIAHKHESSAGLRLQPAAKCDAASCREGLCE